MYTPPLPQKNNLSHSNKKSTAHDSDARPLRVYQVWQGRNKFLFGGRVIFGPDIKSIFLTLALILAPVILFWTFVSKGIVTAFPHGWGIFLIVFSGILTLHIIVLLFLTSGTDPGIIPRNSLPPEPDDGDSSILSLDWTGSQINQGIPPTKNVTVNGMVVKVKYCQTCKLYRPPRCSHCSICNNCVERFDHHCPWVGQCIGKRNYRYFFMFVSFTFLLCMYVLVCCSINISMITHKNNCGFWKAVQVSPISGALMMYTFTVCWFVGGLTTFHLYLITTNQTTYENFRYQYDRKMNPYNLGCSRNCEEVFWAKIPSSRNDFRAKVEVESSFDFSSSSSSSREMKPQMSVDGDDFEYTRRQGGSSEPRWEHKIDWGISPENV